MDMAQVVLTSRVSNRHATGVIAFVGKHSGYPGVHGSIDNIVFRTDYCANTGTIKVQI